MWYNIYILNLAIIYQEVLFMKKLFILKNAATFLLAATFAAGAVMPGFFFGSSSSMMAFAAEDEEINNEKKITEDTNETVDNSDTGENADKSEFDFAKFFSNEDTRRVTERALKYYAEDFYRTKTGETPANIDIKMPVDDETVVITLTDENDKVLDVYYINCWQYTGVDQNGEYADLIANDKDCYQNEDGYFAPLYNAYDAVVKHYTENYNTVPLGNGFFNNTENRLFNGNSFEDFYLMDDKGQTIIKYVIDPATGKGTDSNGNDVDLVPYIHPECRNICSYIRKHYQERNGEQLLVTYFDPDDEEKSARVLVTTTDDKILDVYTVDLRTLMAETEGGETVNLYVYSYLPIMKNTDFREVGEKIIEYLADRYYTEKTGEKAAKVTVNIPYDGFNADVSLTDDKGNVLEVYTVDVWSYSATDSKGNKIELRTSEFDIDEDGLFAPYYNFYEIVNTCYNETYGGTSFYRNSFSSPEINLIINGTDNVNFYIIDDDFQTLEIYSVERATGIAFDSKGNSYDLKKYITPESIKLCELVRKDYRSRNGEQKLLTNFGYNEDRTRIRIHVLNNSNDVFDIYEIDPVTWIAETASGNTVDLKVYDEITGDKDKDYFAPLSQMAGMAETDYTAKNEKAPAKSELKNNLDGSFSVILSDDNGEVLDKYTFDPKTGKGNNNNGDDIDLPQTGMSGTYKVLAGIAALMSVTGIALVKKNRKEDLE